MPMWETTDLIPDPGTSPGEGNGNSLQDSCLEKLHGQRGLAGCSPWGRKELDMTKQLENPMGGGAWKATVHGVGKSQTRLSDFTFPFHFHALEKEMATHSRILAWKNAMDKGAWQAAVHGVAKSWT